MSEGGEGEGVVLGRSDAPRSREREKQRRTRE